MGDDLTVVNAARVSFGKKTTLTYTTEKDDKLIRYLAKHRHMSPFGHCFASFHIKAPIFVARQLVKHKFLRWNEISRRYVDTVPDFYEPATYRRKAEDKKQGSGESMTLSGETMRSEAKVILWAKKTYGQMIKEGVCPEQARMVLPQSTMTEWYWSGSLDAFADMCILRLADDTQEETRQVVLQINNRMKKLFPVSWLALTGEEEADKRFDEDGENNPPVSSKDIWHGNATIRPMNDEERKRAMERKELNQAWYDSDGGELFK